MAGSPWSVWDSRHGPNGTPALGQVTGVGPAAPPIPGLDATPYLTYEAVSTWCDCRLALLVVGGGAIGCEPAQAFAWPISPG